MVSSRNTDDRKHPRRNAFGPECRVKKRKEFLAIQASRRKVRSNSLLFAIGNGPQQSSESDTTLPGDALLGANALGAPAPGAAAPGAKRAQKTPRLGITVTTKVHKRAVRRNYLKRLLREVFRKERLHLLAPLDIVVIALEGSTDLDYQAVRSEFRFAMRKAGLLPYRQK